MFSLFFFFFSLSKSSFYVDSNGTILKVPKGFVLVLENPEDFRGLIPHQEDGKFTEVFGKTPYYIINFTVDSYINITALDRDVSVYFKYQLFKPYKCSAIEILMDPPAGHKVTFSNDKDHNPTYLTTPRLRVCFWYMWKHYFSGRNIYVEDSLPVESKFLYITDPVYEYPDYTDLRGLKEVIYDGNYQPASSFVIIFDADKESVQLEDDSYFMITKSDGYGEKPTYPNITNMFCVNFNVNGDSGTQCEWINTIKYGEMNTGNIVVITASCIIGVIILFSWGQLICCEKPNHLCFTNYWEFKWKCCCPCIKYTPIEYSEKDDKSPLDV